MHFIEPQLGQDTVLFLYNWMSSSETLLYIIPTMSDIFVFTYPVFLVVFYLYGIFKKKLSCKIGAIYIFFSTVFATILNISVQFFVEKQRPIYFYGFKQEQAETLLHNYLPSSSFPSDHAEVSFAVATATLLWAIKTKSKILKVVSLFLFIFAVLMGFGRITTAVHRPTDIMAGTLIGVIGALFLFQKNIAKRMEKNIYKILTSLEERIILFLGFKK